MILSSISCPLTVQGEKLGSPVTLTLPDLGRVLGLRYACAAAEGVIREPGKFTRAVWTPPPALAAQYPDREKIPVTLILEAYTRGAVTERRRTQVLLAVPEECLPELRLTVSEESGGEFVQGKSRAVTEVTAAGSLGAAIADCVIACGGLTGQGQRLTFDLPQAGNITVTARVTDSRGRKAEASKVISVRPGTAGGENPLLDLNPGDRALGIGCRGDRKEALSVGLTVDMQGRHLTGLPAATEPGDAVPLSQMADFLTVQKLWENPEPGAAFPAQTVAASGGLLLVEAAEQAGSAGRVWEIVGTAGAIRVLSGGTAAVRGAARTAAGLEFGSASPDDSWAVPLTVYALKGGI